MIGYVLDASVAAVWLFEDEADPLAEAALVALAHGSAAVPSLWHFELRNCLLSAERRGRLTEAAATERLAALAGLPILTDHAPRLDIAMALARTQGLTFHDALYLELAQRHGVPLASLDRGLVRAAQASGVAVLSG